LSAPLDRELDRVGAAALVALGAHGGDADLAAFLAGHRVGDAFVVVPRGGAARLAYLTPMEREEAAATGLGLLSPEELGVARLTRESPDPSAFLAGIVAAGLNAAGVAPGRVALAGSWPAGVVVEACAKLADSGWSFVPGNEAMRRARKAKTADEVAEIRRAAGGVEEAYRRVAALLASAAVREDRLELEGEPLKVARLKREVATIFAEHGLEQPQRNIVAPAEEGAVPHTTGTPERELKTGESLVVDLFPKGTLFADVTRTFCVGEPPEELRRAHADALEALRLAHRESVAGVRGWAVQQVVCDLLGSRGWETPISHPGTLTGYVHNLGHGVGYELHEYPSFRNEAGDEGLLETGDVVTLEPGLYRPQPGGFGVRLEDMVWLSPDGPVNLTPWPYDLDPRAWLRG
jgi:Xaa-Pro aminopeptidase